MTLPAFPVSRHPNTMMIHGVYVRASGEEAIETPRSFSAPSLSFSPLTVYHVSLKPTCLARFANQVQFKSIQTILLHIARCMRHASVFVYYLYHRRVYCVVTIAGPHDHSLIPHFL